MMEVLGIGRLAPQLQSLCNYHQELMRMVLIVCCSESPRHGLLLLLFLLFGLGSPAARTAWRQLRRQSSYWLHSNMATSVFDSLMACLYNCIYTIPLFRDPRASMATKGDLAPKFVQLKPGAFWIELSLVILSLVVIHGSTTTTS